MSSTRRTKFHIISFYVGHDVLYYVLYLRMNYVTVPLNDIYMQVESMFAFLLVQRATYLPLMFRKALISKLDAFAEKLKTHNNKKYILKLQDVIGQPCG